MKTESYKGHVIELKSSGKYVVNGVQQFSTLIQARAWVDKKVGHDWLSNGYSVAVYFRKVLGRDPNDATLKDLPLDSPCGKDCRKAIDAAAEMIKHIHAAIGLCTVESEQIRCTCDLVCQVYWRG